MNKGFCSDLHWWCTFLSEWNGVSLLHTLRTPDMVVQTDASGSWGCAAFFSGEWLQWQWTSEWAPVAIMAKELVPIILSCAVWGPQMLRKSVLFQCDNTGVVVAIKKGSSKEDRVMQLLCALWFFVAHFEFIYLLLVSILLVLKTLQPINYPGLTCNRLSYPIPRPVGCQLHFSWNSCKLSPCPARTGHHQHSHSCSALLSKGLVGSTQRSYQACQKHYLAFCSEAHRPVLKPHCQCLLATLRVKASPTLL